jgi:formylglycine-generating enzyme required for sulfatase activity
MSKAGFTERVSLSDEPSHPGVIWIPGGTFAMGSDKHYPEEAPVHRVAVDGFWIDRTPVTNRQFMDFVRGAGHVTFAELAPDPKNYPGALPDMLYAGSLAFAPPGRPAVTAARSRCAGSVLLAGKPTRRWRAGQLRPLPAADQDSPKGHQRRFAFVRGELLPPLPSSRAPRGGGGYVNQPRRI